MPLLGIMLLACIFLFRILPGILTLIISCDKTYIGRYIKVPLLLLFGGSSIVINLVFYLLLHHIWQGNLNFMKTAGNIVQFRFSYQEIDYFPTTLIICTAFAILLGFALRFILSLISKRACNFGPLTVRQKIFLFMTLSAVGAVSIGSYYCGFSGQRHIIINEICSNNESIMLDMNGNISDYIELYNTGFLSCELEHLYLSDEENNLQKYEVPFCTLSSGEYLIIRSRDLNLSLKKSGGQKVFLSDSLGNILDQVTTAETDADFSYARQTDGSSNWDILSCTPGANNTAEYPAVSKPILSHESGFYANAFDLTISAEPGAVIYYTLDGSTPTKDSPIYTEPIHVYDKSLEANVYRSIQNVTQNWQQKNLGTDPVDKAFIVRTVAVSEDGQMSQSVTATYFIAMKKYKDEKVLSLIADPEDLFGTDGIYVTGAEYDSWYLGGQEGEAPTPNFEKSKECPAVFELLEDGHTVSQQPVGISIQGASSRSSNLKRFSIYARKQYSGSKYFDICLFKGKKTHSIVLRSGFENAFTQYLVNGRDIATLQSMPVSVFLNGEYWYTTYVQEKYNKYYFAETYGVTPDNVESIKNDIPPEIYDFLLENDMSVEADYKEFSQIADVQSYIDFHCVNVYLANMDYSDFKNTFAWHTIKKENEKYGDGRWRWALYDMDLLASGTRRRVENPVDTDAELNSFSVKGKAVPKAFNQGFTFEALKKSDIFCKQFVLTFMDLVNTLFEIENVTKKLEEWGEDISYNDYFFARRPEYITAYMKEEFALSGTLETLTLSVNDTKAGYITLNTITPDLSDGAWGGKYYTDYPVTVTAVANDGYEFAGWSEGYDSTENSMEVFIKEGGTSIRAIFRKTN